MADAKLQKQVFDYVIVGAGAAGCVLANRLSADPAVSVCLLDAGPDDKHFFIGLPAGFVKILGNDRYVTHYPTEPTTYTAGRSVSLTQGKTLGGGTSVNGMAYNRGQKTDFDEWAAQGNPGWSYADLLPLFRDLETREGGDPEYRGSKGPLAVTNVVWDDPLCRSFINGAVQSGIPINADTNAAAQAGVTFSQVNISKGKRVSSSSAFLKPIRSRRNLQVLTDTRATRVLFEGKKAVGVRCMRDGVAMEIGARCDVIVSAGAIATAQLLQVSGIGDAQLLGNIGVPIVHELPGVGQNFQDHYMVGVVARGKDCVTINQMATGPQLWAQVARWLVGQPSILGLPVALIHYFARSGLSQGDADIQGIFTPASHMTGGDGALDRHAGMTCAFWQHRPLSRGHVSARSANMLDMPVVQPNYLQHEHDRQVLLAACKTTRRILESPAMKPYFDAELAPGPGVRSDDEWLDFAYKTGSTVYHPCGTAKMGPASNRMSVVDPASMRVHGVEGLRVIDSSIMPSVTSGNTAAATMVIGEKGARLMLQR
ncbi:GMC family oxidoreductase [Hydrocarboniphaga effusa]|uniref:GMC family oxidoreductase n=1 Tax=Hydrocarboniphaga effusa TaxID=243629 RepID=UPI003BAB2F15